MSQLIVIDAHSKWIEATFLSSATSAATIEFLRSLFARFGIPSTVVSDNATYFVSEDIESFFTRNGISHKTSLPYHPQSNGLAERAVQIVKKGLRKVTEGTLNTRLSKVLFTYRTTPQSSTGLSPADLLLHYKPLTRLDFFRQCLVKWRKVSFVRKMLMMQHPANVSLSQVSRCMHEILGKERNGCQVTLSKSMVQSLLISSSQMVDNGDAIKITSDLVLPVLRLQLG